MMVGLCEGLLSIFNLLFYIQNQISSKHRDESNHQQKKNTENVCFLDFNTTFKHMIYPEERMKNHHFRINPETFISENDTFASFSLQMSYLVLREFLDLHVVDFAVIGLR